jgi:uncharacterized membrane protein YedE/YeeE
VTNVVAFASGCLFAAGLVISGMTRPSKVVAFLDLFGAWDPSLMFVMGGAVATYGAIYWTIVRHRERPLFAERFTLPSRSELDTRLFAGAVLFGIGWALGGFCPGPAVAALVTGDARVIAFSAAMIAGMAAHRLFQARLSPVGSELADSRRSTLEARNDA